LTLKNRGVRVPRSVRQLLAALQLRSDRLGREGLEERIEWTAAYPVGGHLDSLLAIAKEDWAGLAAVAQALRQQSDADLNGIVTQQREVARFMADVDELRVRGQAGWTVPGRHDQWSAIREKVESEGQRNGYTAAQIQRVVKQTQTLSWSTVMSGLDGCSTHWSSELEVGARLRFRAHALADLCEAVAALCTSSGSGTIPSIEAINETRDGLLLEQRRLQEALASGIGTDILAVARTAGARAKRELLRLARVAARTAKPAERTRAIAVGDAIREALVVRTAARLVGWLAGWPAGAPAARNWYAAATKLRAGSAERLAAPVTIQRIERNPAGFDGRTITVAGTVVSVDIRHRARKPISAAVLADGDAQVQIGIPHIKLDSGGLVPGSHAVVRGTFHLRAKDFTGPVLILEQRQLVEDGRKFWLDWLRAEVQPFIAPVPHNLTIRPSWVAGKNGAANLLRYGTWSTDSERSVL